MHEHDDCWQEYCARAGDTERIAEIPNLIDLSFVLVLSASFPSTERWERGYRQVRLRIRIKRGKCHKQDLVASRPVGQVGSENGGPPSMIGQEYRGEAASGQGYGVRGVYGFGCAK